MSTTVVVTHTDVEPQRGTLYLPGEPVLFDDFAADCALCQHQIREEPDYATGGTRPTAPENGQHSGIVDLPGSGEIGELVHLRCVVDAVELGDTALVIGEIGGNHGRHHA